MKLTFGLTARLSSYFLLFGIVPMVILAAITFSALDKMKGKVGAEYQNNAANIADKIDRNLFERYGDVQAFGLNRVVFERSNWYKADAKNSPLVQTMNQYVSTYGLYSLTLFVDTEGRVIAVNSKDNKGNDIDSRPLYEKNYFDSEWFKAVESGSFTTKMPFTAPGNDLATGTYIEDVHVDDDVKLAYKGDDGLTIGFSAPVRDPNGKTIGYWSNRTKFSTVEEMIQSAYLELAAADKKSAEITLLDGKGNIIVDHDPSTSGTTEIKHDLSVIGKLNLVDKKIMAAAAAVDGKSGYGFDTHARKKIDQVAGYTHLKGALGYPGMNWSVLVRSPVSEAAAEIQTIASQVWVTIFACVGLILGIGFWIGRKMGNSIRNSSEKLMAAATEVSAAAGQISQSSQSLAEGASEQAASIEETSASMEEMSSMTKHNADSSKLAASLMTEAQRAVSKAADSTEQMQMSMKDIKSASDQTSKIIRTIDEIAFQTNLLALNAAVEAARAGEAGKGFAVVAEEVRNLAMRSAEAARNTSALIEDTVTQVSVGVNVVDGLKSALTEVTGSATKVGQLVQEIAAASSEQSTGIEQINTAINQMNKVTQQNAASAEESASASEEMNGQAESMRSIVSELLVMVNGRADGDHLSTGHTSTRHSASAASRHSQTVSPKSKKAPMSTGAQIIPFDDDDLSKF